MYVVEGFCQGPLAVRHLALNRADRCDDYRCDDSNPSEKLKLTLAQPDSAGRRMKVARKQSSIICPAGYQAQASSYTL